MNGSASHTDKWMSRIEGWFKTSGKQPFDYQRSAWQSYLDGCSGLIHAPTGTGKTLAAFLGAVIEAGSERVHDVADSESSEKATSKAVTKARASKRARAQSKLRVLWLTPLRALAADTEENLKDACEQLQVPWHIERRTGDTAASLRRKQDQSLPEVLITTPESLTLLLTREESATHFNDLRLIVVDEWHELMSTKRGVQTELALARFRRFQPNVRVWGLSATIGNLSTALVTLLGHGFDQAKSRLIRGDVQKEIEIRSLLPEAIERFPWAGHLGDRLAGPVAKLVQQAATTLIFTNTRSQSEIWYRSLLNHLPELAGLMAVHHGSLDTELRTWIERQLRSGKLRCCVCTSSLDLGVDFPTVDQVIQIGSPKGNARLVQRAGRSGHRPHVPSRIVFVPTHALELVELSALRKSVAAGQIEPRIPLRQPLDVLAQHVVSMALAGGIEPESLYEEVKSTAAYHELSQEAWRWVLDFVERGGSSLQAYPDYHRIHNIDGTYQVTDRGIARRHRMSIGTIVSDASIQVKFLKGKAVGSVEESFVSRMEAGDRFMLAGKVLELVKLQDNTAWVRRAKGNVTAIPRWMGGRMPLSTELSQALREELEIASSGKWDSVELQAVRPLLELQQTLSVLPTTDELLIERWESRDGHHLFLYPFEGRLAHEGLAALFALRFSRLQAITFSMAMNDYGIVFVSENAAPIDAAIQAGLFAPESLDEDIAASLNGTEMWRRQFRETARIAGLLHQGYPGERKKASHLQASSNLFFEVFRQFDPSNLLLRQAQREVLDQQLEKQRMILALERMRRSRLIVRDLPQPSPLCFPLLVDRLRDRLSSETLADRVRKLQQKWESEADRRTAKSGR